VCEGGNKRRTNRTDGVVHLINEKRLGVRHIARHMEGDVLPAAILEQMVASNHSRITSAYTLGSSPCLIKSSFDLNSLMMGLNEAIHRNPILLDALYDAVLFSRFSIPRTLSEPAAVSVALAVAKMP
jgi:hypothetical protein